MPFAFLAENPNKYRDVVTVLGPCHTQCVMVNAIYKHYKGCEPGDVLVKGRDIAEASVDSVLKGKHYKWRLRCMRLVYEARDKGNLDIYESLSQESHAAVHVALEDDVDPRESTATV